MPLLHVWQMDFGDPGEEAEGEGPGSTLSLINKTAVLIFLIKKFSHWAVSEGAGGGAGATLLRGTNPMDCCYQNTII